MKPIYKILIAVGLVTLFGALVYVSWRRFTAPQKQGGEGALSLPLTTSTVKTAPPKTQEGEVSAGRILKKLSDQEVFDYWVVPGAQEVYYIARDGRIFLAKEGEDVLASQQTLQALNSIQPTSGGEAVLAAFGDPFSPQWGIFDTADKVWRPLPQEIIQATWAGDVKKLIALVKNVQDINLVEVDLNKTPPTYKTLLRDFRMKDVTFFFQTPSRLLLTEKPSSLYASNVWQLDLKNLTTHLLIAREKGLYVSRSSDDLTFFSFSSPQSFRVLDNDLKAKLVSLPFGATMPDKCDATQDKLYCFVPRRIPNDAVLPDDYLKNKVYFTDDLFVINTVSGEDEEVLLSGDALSSAVDGRQPRVLENRFYFINRYGNFLYALTPPGAS